MECPDCGMLYVPSIPSNEEQHRPYHDQIVNGYRARPAKSENVLLSDAGFRITVVTPFSPRWQRTRAARVISGVNVSELGYDGGQYDEDEEPDRRALHIYLSHCGIRIIGFLKMEKRARVARCTWGSKPGEATCEELHGHPPVWTVALIWTHRSRRMHGLGRRLLDQASSDLDVSCQALAWYTPFTEAGERFVRALHPDSFLAAG